MFDYLTGHVTQLIPEMNKQAISKASSGLV